MYENTGIYQVSGKCYPRTYYSLGIGCIEYVNGIFNFMTNNHCCFYDSGVLEQGKTYGFSYRIKKGNTIMLELDSNKVTLHFFINKEIHLVVLTDVRLPTCFLIVLVNKTHMIEFDFLHHLFDSSYDTKFIKNDEKIKWINKNY
jgi:hypothetical protein